MALSFLIATLSSPARGYSIERGNVGSKGKMVGTLCSEMSPMLTPASRKWSAQGF